MRTRLFVLLTVAVFASEKYENTENDTKAGETIEEKNTEIVVKIEESEYAKKSSTSDYIGVTYNKNGSMWRVHRWSKNEKQNVYYGSYDNEETAAHASDTLARTFLGKGEKGYKLNFPDDETEVHKKQTSSKFIGVAYKKSKWRVERWSKKENKKVSYGYYDDEGTAAHASDTLARKLMKNGEQGHKLNFPEYNNEVHNVKKQNNSKYIGVTYNKRDAMWRVYRQSKNERKLVSYGSYENEETAAHASDTLARKLMGNSEQGHKLNFPDDDTEVHPEEKKFSSKYIGVCYHKTDLTWCVDRWCKNEKKKVYNGCYDSEEIAAHASDTLARKLMGNGERDHKLNFPDDDTEVHPEYQNKKRKRKENFQDN